MTLNLAGMSEVNSELARYILRSMDVANGMTDAGARARLRGRSGELDLPPDPQFTLSG